MQRRLLCLPVTSRAAVVLLAAAWMTAGCSHPKEGPAVATQTVGGLTISFTTSPWPPHSGDITGIVGVSDAATGAAVDDASVVASADMTAPRNPGAPASGRFQGNGQYEVPLRVIATTYSVDVHIERPGQPAADADFPLDVWQ
ncbi:MAG: hypothetical protein ACLQVD_12550 [Capsulimonadaceae bacterium]